MTCRCAFHSSPTPYLTAPFLISLPTHFLALPSRTSHLAPRTSHLSPLTFDPQPDKTRKSSVPSLLVMGSFQGVNVIIYFSLLLLPTIRTWRPGAHSKASLGKHKGRLLMGTYVLVLAVCAPLLLAVR